MESLASNLGIRGASARLCEERTGPGRPRVNDVRVTKSCGSGDAAELLRRRQLGLPAPLQAVGTERGIEAENLLELLHRVQLGAHRSEEHTSELQSLMRISNAVFCLKKTTAQEWTRTLLNHEKQIES